MAFSRVQSKRSVIRRTAHRRSLRRAAAIVALVAGALGPAATASGQARGIDVSRFQGKIKWQQVAKTKTRFAFVQASRGRGDDCAVVPESCGRDLYYRRNYRRARAYGIRVGAYHRAFAGGRTTAGVTLDARAEADVFISEVGAVSSGDLLPALDVEHPFGGLNAQRLQLWLRTWLERVEAALGVKPIIYTNASSWSATGDTTEFALAGNPLWVANWGVPEPAVPADYWGGQGWSIWQYTSSGRVRGIAGNVDRNRAGVPLREVTVP